MDRASHEQNQAVVPSDRITLPDTKREFHSSSGRFNFVVSTRDGWKSLLATGDLFSVNGLTAKLLWSRGLPQQFGPRFALVNDLGTVLMLDEWININSHYAVLLIDRDNRTGNNTVQMLFRRRFGCLQMKSFGWQNTAGGLLSLPALILPATLP